VRRFRHVILILIGRAPYAYSTERMEFEMALDKFTAAAAELNTAADALIAKAASDATNATQAQSDLAAADDTATAAIQPITDKINTALNPPSAA
jgi:hypothetical protein